MRRVIASDTIYPSAKKLGFFFFFVFLLHQHCRGSLGHSLVVQFVGIIPLIATGIKP